MATRPKPVFTTKLGELYEADCMAVLPTVKAASVDMVFADPPFNLKKHYGRRSSDAEASENTSNGVANGLASASAF